MTTNSSKKAFKMATIKKPRNNPLVTKPTHKLDVPPLDKIKSSHFIPALDWAIAKAQNRIEKIKAIKTPTFENIIEALENAEPELSYVAGVYSNFNSVYADKKMKEIEGPISETLSTFSNKISLDTKLFKQIKAVYDQKDQLNLDAEQMKLLEDTYKSYTRSGALLDATNKKTLAKMNIKLSKLGTQFGTNVLNSTNNFELFLENKDALKGLPENAIAAAAEMAEAKGKKGQYLLTLHAPSVLPILKYAEDRNLREKIWRAFTRQGTESATDNRPLVKEILELRHKKAQLLGYETYADFVLEERMAGSKEAVFKMNDNFRSTVTKAAKSEFKELQDFIAKNNGPKTPKPWDTGFYSEKLRKEKYGFDSEVLREYLSFDNVAKGAFDVASKLYNIDIKKSSEYPKYHDETDVYEISDKKTGDIIGVLYTDFFPRDTKRPGAWMNLYRSQGRDENGKRTPPIVCIHGNFTKPTKDKPSLLTMDEVTTFFHEFGHGLHGLLSDVKYESMSGTNVKWDFVELPSQLMENWAKEKEVLDMFARHYKDDSQKIPPTLLKQMKAAETFQTGMGFMRQMRLGHLDMSWHTTDPATINDIEKFEWDTCKQFDLMPHENSLISPQFGHLFAGGYAAGYYSYKWAEILEADAFEVFKENGLFHQPSAQKFRELLSKGGSEDPSKLYKDFRGKSADSKALLRREGLIKPANQNKNITPKPPQNLGK